MKDYRNPSAIKDYRNAETGEQEQETETKTETRTRTHSRKAAFVAAAILFFAVFFASLNYFGASYVAEKLGHDEVTLQDYIIFNTLIPEIVMDASTDSDRPDQNPWDPDPGENLFDRISVVPKDDGPSAVSIQWHLTMNEPRTLTFNSLEHEIKLVATSARMAGISVDGEVIFMGLHPVNAVEVNGLKLVLESVEDGSAVVEVTQVLEESQQESNRASSSPEYNPLNDVIEALVRPQKKETNGHQYWYPEERLTLDTQDI